MSGSKTYIIIGFALMVAGAAPAMAGMNGTEWLQRMEQAKPKQFGGAPTPSDGIWTGARVKSVDRAGNRLTIAHRAIRKVGMPAMTMTFPVGDSSHLGMLHKGDAVAIHVASRGGVVQIVDFRMNH